MPELPQSRLTRIANSTVYADKYDPHLLSRIKEKKRKKKRKNGEGKREKKRREVYLFIFFSRVVPPLGLALFSPGASEYFAIVLSSACKCGYIELTLGMFTNTKNKIK